MPEKFALVNRQKPRVVAGENATKAILEQVGMDKLDGDPDRYLQKEAPPGLQDKIRRELDVKNNNMPGSGN